MSPWEPLSPLKDSSDPFQWYLSALNDWRRSRSLTIICRSLTIREEMRWGVTKRWRGGESIHSSSHLHFSGYFDRDTATPPTLWPIANLQGWKVKPMRKCQKPAFYLMTIRGRLDWLQKEVWLYGSPWENDPTSLLIYYLSKLFPNEFMVSITSFMSSSIQPDVHFVNYGPI